MKRLLDIKSKSETPGIWVVHGHENRAVKYPFDLKEKEITMELLLVWARRILLEIELPELEKYLKELES